MTLYHTSLHSIQEFSPVLRQSKPMQNLALIREFFSFISYPTAYQSLVPLRRWNLKINPWRIKLVIFVMSMSIASMLDVIQESQLAFAI